jgi:hypothetical protein
MFIGPKLTKKERAELAKRTASPEVQDLLAGLLDRNPHITLIDRKGREIKRPRKAKK